ncbi:hypothetical protein ILUMI_12166 [Ignelater luminosus]|uniref:Replication factor C subunit 2 n=1 Tax=Ignelater luminosus TaxID=2038154 RepID=A0A8K0GD83_IGNLU|nr:hypothetical protein ILUMI_12166 [Ignelater luminosus]
MESFLKSGKLGGPSSEKSTPSTLKSNKKISRPVPWVEKYRPRNVNDVVEQNEAVAVLQQCIAGADLPNLLFYGPPGTGKTSTILAAARQLFGDMYKNRILELNASDERGIQVIRDKVKTFAQLTASGVRPDGKPCPAFKIIILDEADSMTNAAQAALRRTMEKESKTTRFCLICNYVSRIIGPLTSRCTKFQFKPLDESMIFERLRYICNEEGVKCEDDVLKVLVSTSGGDMRRAITCLQSCSRLKGSETSISMEDVYEITGVVPERWINNYLSVCKENNYNKLETFIDDFILEAYSALQILEQVNHQLINSNELNNKQKAIIGEKLGVVSYRLQDGGSEYIQLLDLGCSIMQAYALK